MEDNATLALSIQFAAGLIASLVVLRRGAWPLALVLGMSGTTIGGILLPRWLMGLPDGNLNLMIVSFIGALAAAWLMRLIILYSVRRQL